MSLTREERKLLHQKSKQPTFGTGAPDNSEGNEGEVAYRQVADSGLVQYVKNNGDWVAVASSGEMPPVRIVGGGTSGSTGVTAHSSLTGLSSDDHTQYLLIDGSRAMTSVIIIGSDADGTDRSITWGHSTLKTIMGIDDSSDAFVINTDDAFDATLANNSFSIDASHNVIIAGTTTTGSGGFKVGNTTITTSQYDVSSGDFTLDVAGDIVLSADGDQIKMDDGTTTRFVFNVDSTPEIDVTGAFIVDGSSTITLDAVSNIDFFVNSREVFKVDTTGHIFLHAAAQSLEEDYSITMKSGNYHFTTGADDFQQNYSWVGDHFISTAYNTDYGS